MTVPQDTTVTISKKWNGFDSSGRYAGNPAIFLYYSDEEVNSTYTVMSIKKEFDGWGWSQKLRSYGVDLVFSSFVGTEPDGDPLNGAYSTEISDLLFVLDHQDVRMQTPAYHVPDDGLDDLIDHYTVRLSADRYRNSVDEFDESVEWFANKSRRRDNVDFVIEFDGLRKNRQYLPDFVNEYTLPRDRVWAYASDEEDIEKLVDTAKYADVRTTLPPDYFRVDSE